MDGGDEANSTKKYQIYLQKWERKFRAMKNVAFVKKDY
jgi:hypothetical protein